MTTGKAVAPNIRTRPAEARDIDRIAEFNSAMASETEGATLHDATVRAGVRAIFCRPERGCYTIAEVDGVVAGCLLITHEWSDWRNGDIWWIQSVYVHPEYRRMGVYRSLYERIHREARQREDVAGIRLYVDKGNSNAQLVYERLGMTRTRYDIYEVDFAPDRQRRRECDG